MGLFTRRSRPAWDSIEQFNALTEHHYPTVFAVAMARLGQHEAAEDVSQETFLRAFLQYDVQRGAASLGPWLIHVARNLAVDLQRRGKDATLVGRTISATEHEEVLSMKDQRPTQTEVLAAQEDVFHLEQALESLPVEEREIVLLHFMEGMTKREIAARLGMHPSSVGRQIDRSLTKMRDTMEGQLSRRLAEKQSARRVAQTRTVARIAGIAALGTAARAEALAQVALQQTAWVVAAANQSAVSVSALSLPASLIGSGVTAMASIKGAVIVGAVVLAAVFSYGPVTSTFRNPQAGTTPTLSSANNAEAEEIATAAAAAETVPSEADTVFVQTSQSPTAAASGTSGAFHVYGKVTNQAGDLLEGVHVSFYTMTVSPGRQDLHSAGTMTTGADGAYRLRAEAVPTDGYYVVSEHRDYELQRVQAAAASGREARHDLVLGPAPLVAGVVVDDEENPLPDVRIVKLPSRLPPEPTDAEGRFRIYGGSSEGNFLTFEKTGYRTIRTKLLPGADHRIIMSNKGASLSGRVTYLGSGLPVPGATVTLTPKTSIDGSIFSTTVTADEAGNYEILLIQEGAYSLAATKDNMRNPMDEESDTISFAATDRIEGHDLKIFSGYVVSGKVLTEEDKQPVEGARIYDDSAASGFRTPVEAFSDEEGNFVLGGLFRSAARLQLKKKGYRLAAESSESATLRMETGTPYRIPAGSLETTVEMLVSDSITVSGRVVDPNGSPRPDAKVLLYDQNTVFGREPEPIPVEADGTFELETNANGTCYIAAIMSGGLEAYSDMVSVVEESVEGVDVVVHPPVSVGGVVIGPDEKPLPGAKVHVTHMSPQLGLRRFIRQLGDVVSDANGAFRFNNLPPSTLLVNASATGYAKANQENLKLAPGESRLDLRLQPHRPLSISGRIIDEDGNGVEGALIFATGAGHTGHTQTLSKTGEFRIESIPDGEYRFQVSKGKRIVEKQAISAGTQDLEIVLPKEKAYRVEGYLIDRTTRSPIPTGTVTREATAEEVEVTRGRFVLEDVKSEEKFTIAADGYLELPIVEQFPESSPETIERTYELSRGGSIAGTVLDRSTREPVADVEVTLLREIDGSREATSLRATSDAEGRFELEGAPAGRILLEFVPPAPYTGRRAYFTAADGTRNDMGEVLLGSGASITVTVTQMPDNTPLADATVTLRGQGRTATNQSMKTDAQGRVLFAQVATGSYDVSSGDVTVRVAEVREDDEREVHLRVGNQVLKARLLQGGKPIAGSISLSAMHKGTMVLRSGYAEAGKPAEISGIFPGTWRLTVYPAGHLSPEVGRKFINYETEVEIGTDSERDFHYPSGVIRVSVSDESGEPIEGATVKMHSSSRPSVFHSPRDVTDKEGTFLIHGFTPGPWEIVASKEGLVSGTVTVNAGSPDDTLTANLTLGSSETGTLDSGAYRLSDGEPIPQAWLRVQTESGLSIVPTETLRDNNGRVKVTLPVGTYRTNVSHWGHSESRRTVTITAGETTTIDDVLYEAGSFRWILHDDAGAPLAGVSCTITPRDPSSIESVRTGTTGTNGYFDQRGLHPGEYTATAALSSGRTLSLDFDILPHEHTERISVGER